MLTRSNNQRMHSQLQMPRHERERGRSRTPKPTAMAMELRRQEPPRQSPHKRISSDVARQSPRSPRVEKVVKSPPRRPPPKGKSPDRSEPGALEEAIHEAHARGDLRQCLQWVLEIQGVYLEWDDPRLDTVTEDDLCFSEQTGMGPDATPEERQRAEAYWAMRQAEEDEAQRLWELTATPAEKEASRRHRAKYEAEQRKREARAQFFRAPRKDKVVPTPSSRPQAVTSSLPRSLDSVLQRKYTIPRTTRSQPARALFPVDEGELMAVKSMWLDQGRKGLALVEALVRPPVEVPVKPEEITKPRSPPAAEIPRAGSSDSVTSVSTSSSSAPSALFSSVITTTSIATSVSTISCVKSSTPLDLTVKDSFPPSKQVETPATPKFIPVSTSESPLHKHLAHVSLLKSLELEEEVRPQVLQQAGCRTPRRPRTTSESWLARGSKTVGEFVNLVGRLPSAYIPLSEPDTPLFRPASCPPSTHRNPHPYLPPPSISQPETFIYLLPLHPPVYPRKFPPIPTLPRSPYRPLTPPAQPTARTRCVANPQYLRLKALHNRVLWGLVPVPRAECDMLADITQRHRADAYPGRPDVDRFGQMFTTREALIRVVVEGVGPSTLRRGGGDSESAGLWSWLRAR